MSWIFPPLADPAIVNQVSLTDYTETIFPFENKLFLGAYNGMSIYDISDPSTPVKEGSFLPQEPAIR